MGISTVLTGEAVTFGEVNKLIRLDQVMHSSDGIYQGHLHMKIYMNQLIGMINDTFNIMLQQRQRGLHNQSF